MQKRFKALIEANISLAGIESLDELLFRLTTLGKAVTNAEAASIMLYNPEKGVLQFVSSNDEILGEKVKDCLLNTIEIKLGEGIAGWVAKHRKPLIIEDTLKEERHNNNSELL